MLIAKTLEADDAKDLKYLKHIASIANWRQKLLGPRLIFE